MPWDQLSGEWPERTAMFYRMPVQPPTAGQNRSKVSGNEVDSPALQ